MWPHYDYLFEFLTAEQWHDWQLSAKQDTPRDAMETQDISTWSDEKKRAVHAELLKRAAEFAEKNKRGKHRQVGNPDQHGHHADGSGVPPRAAGGAVIPG